MSTRANEPLSGHFGQMGVENMWGLGQMDIWMNGHFGVKGHFGTNEHWGKWA